MKHVKLFLAVALAIALYTGVTVTAASGAQRLAQSTPCVPAMAGGDLFCGLREADACPVRPRVPAA
jgi:hypothetical protein